MYYRSIFAEKNCKENNNEYNSLLEDDGHHHVFHGLCFPNTETWWSMSHWEFCEAQEVEARPA